MMMKKENEFSYAMMKKEKLFFLSFRSFMLLNMKYIDTQKKTNNYMQCFFQFSPCFVCYTEGKIIIYVADDGK